ncbi:pilus assembly protein [Streptomyces sp. D2-8]|uniref:pilus assembly protein n=1 Tax=Streptomyces sp. D2-8 TaxID=2707767 RepID=UPI0020BFC39D|nr:pilus assembly protein [Streptomyces sp. D2-8]
MTPTIIVTLIALWQVVLVGYTYTLAGNAADEAVRQATAAEPGARQGVCEAAGLKHLSDAWRSGASVTCGSGSGYVTADARLQVPVLFPGALTFGFTVHGHAGAVEEAKG